MKVCVQGLWHLGTVTAACLASLDHEVIGFDFNGDIVSNLKKAKLPIFEPNLQEMVESGLQSNKLTFSSDTNILNNIDFLWVAYDTPVDEDDNADVNFVFTQIKNIVPFLNDNAIVLISSQMPIGSIKKLEQLYKNVHFAYSPENLRLGNALNIFLKPDRIIVGVRTEDDKLRIKELLDIISNKIEWMSVESAEMTKHAINSFLAMSVVFSNEIASLCEKSGADAKEVERGLKSEHRIGPKAYVSPGSSFSGGTLARDVEFLKQASYQHQIYVPLLESIKTSNDNHKLWAIRKIRNLFPNLTDVTVTIWGITYKSGTNTLRRSLPLEICNWLLSQEANVKVYDPIVTELPGDLNSLIYKDPLQSLNESSVLLIGNEYPEYKDIIKKYIPVQTLTVIDPNRYLSFLENTKNINYVSVGMPLIEKSI